MWSLLLFLTFPLIFSFHIPFITSTQSQNQNNTVSSEGFTGTLYPYTVCIPNSNPYIWFLADPNEPMEMFLTWPYYSATAPIALNPSICTTMPWNPPSVSGTCLLAPGQQSEFQLQQNSVYQFVNSGVQGQGTTPSQVWVSVAPYNAPPFGCGYGLFTDQNGGLNPSISLCIPNSNPFTTFQTIQAPPTVDYITLSFPNIWNNILNKAVCVNVNQNACTIKRGDSIFLQLAPNQSYQVTQSGDLPIQISTVTIVVSDRFGDSAGPCPIS